MQCFICVTYMFFIATAHPGGEREPSMQPEKRSLFRDVIESLRIRSQIPEDFGHNENNLAHNENNLAQNYNQYGYDNQQELPSDAEFIPRRNDRIEMPPLKYRFPKSLNDTEEPVEPKEEIIVFINTTKEPTTTTKPKKQRRTRPPINRNKTQKHNLEENEQQEDSKPLSNTMAGQSQIGNRESQMVVKPTVIVNIRGSVTHKDGEIRIAGRNTNESNETFPIPNVPQNIFNINQEIKLERTFTGTGSSGGQKKTLVAEQEAQVQNKTKIEEDMMMCETATWNPEKNREGKRFSNVLQILVSV